jgi:hypothetical protein
MAGKAGLPRQSEIITFFFITHYIVFVRCNTAGTIRRIKLDAAECHAVRQPWNLDYFVVRSTDEVLCLTGQDTTTVLKEATTLPTARVNMRRYTVNIQESFVLINQKQTPSGVKTEYFHRGRQ